LARSKEKAHFASPTGVAIALLLVALPAALFYGSLFRHLVNLPYWDDYEAVLDFLNRAVQAKSAADKFWLFLAGQHNEYKIFLVHGLAWAQVGLLGHVNFAQLCVLGDSAVLVLALMLWSMFLPDQKDLTKRLTFFVPVSWLLFQMEYWETLNWAMASLQNLWVIVFSLGAIRWLLRPARTAFACAMVLYALAVAASANGFLVLPVGLLILAKQRQLARAGGLLAATGVCIAAYAYRYNLMSSQVQPGGSVFSELRNLRPDFLIAFVGNAGVMASEPVILALRRLLPGLSIPFEGNKGTLLSEPAIHVATCLALGTFLLVLFGWLVWRGYVSRNPAVSSCVLFLLLTAAGVACLRSGFGLGESLSSRYSIYGVLLLILAWTAVAEEFLQRSEGLHNNRLCTAMAVLTIILALAMEITGTRNLARREDEMVKGMYAFEHPVLPGTSEGPVLSHPGKGTIETAFRSEARQILIASIRLGVYEPPRL
jgi:hypothetical protein